MLRWLYALGAFLGALLLFQMQPMLGKRLLPWFGGTPAVGREQKEAFLEAVNLLRVFRRAHRAAIELWRQGVRDVLFPTGTWMMRWAHGALVAPT